ncbi:hypothetical protein B0H10DRAFT_2195189, partial [Mycena sp. CBHHK59/15]
MSLTSRRLWIDASDAHAISLPLGETLKNTCLSLLPRNAARRVSISQKWKNPGVGGVICPIKTYEVTPIYHLPSWAFWAPLKYSQRSLLGHAPPTFVNILPGGHLFLFGSMGHLGVYDLGGNYGFELEVPFNGRFDPRPGDASTVDWDSLDNGAHITIIVLTEAFNDQHDVE